VTTTPTTSSNAYSGSGNTAASSATSLVALLDRGGDYAAISAYLDALPYAQRLEQVLSVSGARVGRLYHAVAGGPALTFDDIVPTSTPAGETVIHEGRNSLPMFSRFQKRFVRNTAGVIVGYNHQTMSFATGPGYFVTTEADATHPGEIVFDYTQQPSFEPPGWPAYKPNTHLLGRAVYMNMKDYNRRVARGVLVGAAFKNGKAQNAYFTLTVPA
jgi:hypothetical protein